MICYRAEDGTVRIAMEYKEGKMAYLIPGPDWMLGYQVESVSRYQQLTQRNSNGFKGVGAERVHRK